MIDLKQFQKLQELADSLQREQDRKAGELAGLLKQLKEVTGLTTLPGADPDDLFSNTDDILRESQEELDQISSEYEEGLQELLSEYGDKLK